MRGENFKNTMEAVFGPESWDELVAGGSYETGHTGVAWREYVTDPSREGRVAVAEAAAYAAVHFRKGRKECGGRTGTTELCASEARHSYYRLFIHALRADAGVLEPQFEWIGEGSPLNWCGDNQSADPASWRVHVNEWGEVV